MKRYATGILALLTLSVYGGAGEGPGTHHETAPAANTTVTVTGQIVDPVCLIGHGDSGPEHRTCAQACARMGINLAFYNEADQQIYMIYPTGHADPNEKVVEFAEKRVEITGTIRKTPGYQGIEIQSLKELGEGKKIALK